MLVISHRLYAMFRRLAPTAIRYVTQRTQCAGCLILIRQDHTKGSGTLPNLTPLNPRN